VQLLAQVLEQRRGGLRALVLDEAIVEEKAEGLRHRGRRS
jgi:hypothetical protein